MPPTRFFYFKPFEFYIKMNKYWSESAAEKNCLKTMDAFYKIV